VPILAKTKRKSSANTKSTTRFMQRGIRNKPLTDEQKASNNEKSKTRARVEHVFGFMEHSMNRLYVRSIGMARANGFVGLVNLTYNLFRYEQIMRLERISVHNWD
jgi:IS5 family transposase